MEEEKDYSRKAYFKNYFANLSEERKARHLAMCRANNYKRYHNATEEEKEKRKEYYRNKYAAMSPEQKKAYNKKKTSNDLLNDFLNN
jgi:hypothetical protein